MIDYSRTIADILDNSMVEMKRDWDMMPGPQHQFHSSIHIPRWVEEDAHKAAQTVRWFCATDTPRIFIPTEGCGSNESLHNTLDEAPFGFSKQNTAYHRYESIEGTHKLDRWLHDVAQQHLRLESYRIKINRQPPGQMFAEHFDTMWSWRHQFKEEAHQRRFPEIKRYLLFMTDQAVGHSVQTKTGPMQWTQGDIYSLFWYAKHATANASSRDKCLVQFEGFDTAIDI